MKLRLCSSLFSRAKPLPVCYSLNLRAFARSAGSCGAKSVHSAHKLITFLSAIAGMPLFIRFVELALPLLIRTESNQISNGADD
ncbi:hypothetical protein [Malonomonas rubra]|uniref:hypothetical protein n=1 Tax=Malonomonas rubra TaxID=57040 RepID=UPI001114CB79|nr:hypothetical protein [Malonomonas rubra]